MYNKNLMQELVDLDLLKACELKDISENGNSKQNGFIDGFISMFKNKKKREAFKADFVAIDNSKREERIKVPFYFDGIDEKEMIKRYLNFYKEQSSYQEFYLECNNFRASVDKNNLEAICKELCDYKALLIDEAGRSL
jgi:hypothetical protein